MPDFYLYVLICCPLHYQAKHKIPFNNSTFFIQVYFMQDISIEYLKRKIIGWIGIWTLDLFLLTIKLFNSSAGLGLKFFLYLNPQGTWRVDNYCHLFLLIAKGPRFKSQCKQQFFSRYINRTTFIGGKYRTTFQLV